MIDHFTPAQIAANHTDSESKPESVHLAVLLPFRDRWDLTRRALTALFQQQIDGKLTVFLLDNDSCEDKTRAGIAEATQIWPGIQTVPCPGEFNFSAIINKGADAARELECSHYFLLNNDVQLEGNTSLQGMINQSFVPNAGAIGCTLLYPNRTIQHIFAAPGIKIVAAHPLKHLVFNGEHEWFQKPRPVGAVTGAAMLVSSVAFHNSGGFDRDLPTVGQDIDFCLALQKKGYINWVVTSSVGIHHEGASRDGSIDKKQVRYIYEKWGETLTHNPFYHLELSRWTEKPALTIGESDYPWSQVLF